MCRGVGDNNLGGKLPAQYSALTNLHTLCVAPDPIRSRWGLCVAAVALRAAVLSSKLKGADSVNICRHGAPKETWRAACSGALVLQRATMLG
jgi:hypothetical protein